MKKAKNSVFVAVLLGALSAPALVGAQGDDVTEINFDADDLTGALIRPQGENIQVTKRGSRSVLIRIRQNFVPEMLKSVEDL